MEDSIWFSPLNIIYHGELLNKTLSAEEKRTKKFRKVIEAYTVAQMLVGIMVKEKQEYWMQLVEDSVGSPDIRTIRYANTQHGKFDFMEQIDVEVVEYGPYSELSIPEFIAEKKFSKRKSYDENTIILCHVGSGTESYLPDGDTIKKVMDTINSPCSVLFLAGKKSDGSHLGLYSLKPQVGLLLEYNPNIELYKLNQTKKLSGVVVFKRGARRPPTYHPNHTHYPFEKLGYLPTNV